jgi:hypothetical protein
MLHLSHIAPDRMFLTLSVDSVTDKLLDASELSADNITDELSDNSTRSIVIPPI